MASSKERSPVELARFFFIITVFGVVAWMALAFAVLQSPDDPLSVQEDDLQNSIWLTQYEDLHRATVGVAPTQLAVRAQP